jgi:hypothetical protein
VFENRPLRRIFVPNRNEVTGVWRELHNEELHNSYSVLSVIRATKSRRIRFAGHVARIGRIGMYIGFWWEIQKEKRPLERSRRRWEVNIKIYLREIGWGRIELIDLA